MRERALGVEFSAPISVAYRACLESRVAARVFLVVAQFEAATDAQFYDAARATDWRAHIDASRSIACDFTGKHPEIVHTRFGALRLKDAICDQLRETTGGRPDVEPDRPAVRIHAHANGPKVTVSLDLSGEGLHRRGYRTQAGEAPLRENLAAGILLRAGWPEKCAAAGEFLDPMCGSGTLVIEAAMIAANIAPGSRRNYFGFIGWVGHDRAAWDAVKRDALAREHTPAMTLRGLDVDGSVLAAARDNAARAGVAKFTSFERGAMRDARPSKSESTGFLATNPPYGVRLVGFGGGARVDEGTRRRAARTLRGMGRRDPRGFARCGTRARTARRARAHDLQRRARMPAVAPACFRGGGEADDPLGSQRAHRRQSSRSRPARRCSATASRRTSSSSSRGRSASASSCYRLYDADMPEYSFAIDRYAEADSDRVWLYVQEYAPPKTVDPNAAQRRRSEALAALPGTTGVPAERIHLRQRRKISRGDQYEKLDNAGEHHLVEEGGLRFWVNFTDYLDTGLFLDHRLTRARLRDLAAGNDSSTCSPTRAAAPCTRRPAARAPRRRSTCRPPTSIGLSRIWQRTASRAANTS